MYSAALWQKIRIFKDTSHLFFFYLQERGGKNEIQRLVADAKLNSFNNKHQFDMSGVLKKASRVFNATLSWSLLSNQT